MKRHLMLAAAFVLAARSLNADTLGSNEGSINERGDVGASLDGVGATWDDASRRGIVITAKATFPDRMMIAFYRTLGLKRPGNAFTGLAAEGPI